MGCGVSSPASSTTNMTAVAPNASTTTNRRNSIGSEQEAVAALAMKRKNANVRGTKGYAIENDDTPDMTHVDKTDDIHDRLVTALTSHWLFESCMSDQIESIVSVMKPKTFQDGEKLIVQGDENASEFYFVASGSCDVFVDGNKAEHTVSKDQCFGELALFYECPRSATIQASGSAVETFVLDQAMFRHALGSRNEEMLQEHVNFLKQMEVFEDTPERNLKKLAETMGRMQFNDGEFVVTQGEAGEVFYIVVKGSAKVVENDIEKDHTMSKGDWFGERSLITHEVRSASIIAVGMLECVCVSKNDFETYFGSFDSFRKFC